MQFVGNFGYVMVCIVGAVQKTDINGEVITIPTIIHDFMTYVRIFTQPIGQIVNCSPWPCAFEGS